jgi:superfamily II helicase
MRKLWENLRLRLNNYINNGVEANISDVNLGLGKDIFDEKLLSLQEDMSDILKEHEQRKQAIETLVENFKTAAEKRFSRMKKERNSISSIIS